MSNGAKKKKNQLMMIIQESDTARKCLQYLLFSTYIHTNNQHSSNKKHFENST